MLTCEAITLASPTLHIQHIKLQDVSHQAPRLAQHKCKLISHLLQE